MSGPRISHKTELHLVDLLTDWTVREIENLFAGNGMTAALGEGETLDERRWPIGSSVRRHTAASYLAVADLTQPATQASFLRVCDDVFAALDRSGAEGAVKDLQRLLERDGVSFEEPGRIAPAQLRLPEGGRLDQALPDFKLIDDPEVLREHAIRFQRASVAGDAPDAILAARELLESVCKLVLQDYDTSWPKGASTGQLYGLVSKELGLEAGGIEGDDEGAKAARTVLSGLARVADGLGELRTRIGRGHGRTTRSRARQRHAELATGAAATLAVFILDTWHDRRVKDGEAEAAGSEGSAPEDAA